MGRGGIKEEMEGKGTEEKGEGSGKWEGCDPLLQLLDPPVDRGTYESLSHVTTLEGHSTERIPLYQGATDPFNYYWTNAR